jgi:UDPglucose--hexose-1-phosphate uridylyltransferase
MLELRFDPIKNFFIANSTIRQERTFLPPKDFCPLCPTKIINNPTEIPEKDYEIVVLENKFPTFSRKANEIVKDLSGNGYILYNKKRSLGICEVVVYSSNHDLFLEDMPTGKINNLINVWQDRFNELGARSFIKYVHIFENKGKEIGVTLLHPHGQIYAFPFIPPILKTELGSSKKYFEKNKRCIHCDIIKREILENSRIVVKDDKFLVFVPYYARWPYEVHVYPIGHIGTICDLNNEEVEHLSMILKELINRYNKLFNFRMPYVMGIHQNPTDGKNYDYYHLHFEFYPSYRTENKLKYLAGCELSAGTFINDTIPEEKAQELRNVKY